MALASMIILDAIQDPAMLHKPRMILTHFKPQLFQNTMPPNIQYPNNNTNKNNVGKEMGIPHMRLLWELMSDGPITFQQVQNMMLILYSK